MKTVFLLLFLIITGISKAQDTSSIIFAQVYYEKAWRIIDKQGRFMLKQRYGVGAYQNLCFSDGLAISFKEKKCGFTDFNDNQVIPNKYDGVRCFQFGFAAVAVGEKWGIIDRHEKFIVDPDYDNAGNFGPEGLAGLLKDGKLGFVDTTGKMVIPFKYYWFPSLNTFPDYPFFTDGLIAIIDTGESGSLEDGKVGFMNGKGEIMIKPQYDQPGSFAGMPIFINGKATVLLDGTTILIDTLGNQILKPEYGANGFLYFTDGFATIYDESGRQGIISENGTVILKPEYNGVNAFSEGFAAVQISGNENGFTSGFVNKKGEFVFNRKFGFVRDFHEGFAAVEEGGKWGYIDTTGNFIIEPQYSQANEFYQGIAVVAIKKGENFKYGFIDRSDRFIIQPVYNEAYEFHFGLAPVKIGNKFGYINMKGEVIIKPAFDNAYGFQSRTTGWAK